MIFFLIYHQILFFNLVFNYWKVLFPHNCQILELRINWVIKCFQIFFLFLLVYILWFIHSRISRPLYHQACWLELSSGNWIILTWKTAIKLGLVLTTILQLNSLVQDWRKWIFQVNFFSFKSAWIFACAFQLSSKTFPCIFLAGLHFISERNKDKISKGAQWT